MIFRKNKLLIGWLLLSVALSGGAEFPRFSGHCLAPASAVVSWGFVPSEAQRRQARGWLARLDLLIPFLEAVADLRGGAAGEITEEELPLFTPNPIAVNSNESFLPQFAFLNAFSAPHLKNLREVLKRGLNENRFPNHFPLSDIHVGLHRFCRLTASLQATGVLKELELKPYDPREKKLLDAAAHGIRITQYDASGKEAFVLEGPAAHEAAPKVFVNGAVAQQKYEFFNKAALSEKTLDILSQLARLMWQSPGDPTIVAQVHLAKIWVRSALPPPYYPRFLEVFEKGYGLEASEALEEFIRVFNSLEIAALPENEKEGTLSYLNLPALISPTDNRLHRKVAMSVEEVTVNIPALFRLAETLPTAEEMMAALLWRLNPGWGETLKIGMAEVAMSRILVSLPPERLCEDRMFSSLIKTFIALSRAATTYHFDAELQDYVQEVKLNLLRALQKADAHWFRHCLNIFSQQIHSAHLDWEDQVDFLSAAGWLDPATEDVLLSSKRTLPQLRRAQTLLQRGFVLVQNPTSGNGKEKVETWSASETQLEQLQEHWKNMAWPAFLTLQDPWQKLSFFNYIKFKVYLGQGKWDEVTAALAYLTWNEFNQMAQDVTSYSQFLEALKAWMMRRSLHQRLQGLYRRLALMGEPDPLHFPFQWIKRVAERIRSPQILGEFIFTKKDLQAILQGLYSFLTPTEAAQFWENLLKAWHVETLRRELQEVSNVICHEVERNARDKTFSLLQSFVESIIPGIPPGDPENEEKLFEEYVAQLSKKVGEDSRLEKWRDLVSPDVIIGSWMEVLFPILKPKGSPMRRDLDLAHAAYFLRGMVPGDIVELSIKKRPPKITLKNLRRYFPSSSLECVQALVKAYPLVFPQGVESKDFVKNLVQYYDILKRDYKSSIQKMARVFIVELIGHVTEAARTKIEKETARILSRGIDLATWPALAKKMENRYARAIQQTIRETPLLEEIRKHLKLDEIVAEVIAHYRKEAYGDRNRIEPHLANYRAWHRSLEELFSPLSSPTLDMQTQFQFTDFDHSTLFLLAPPEPSFFDQSV